MKTPRIIFAHGNWFRQTRRHVWKWIFASRISKLAVFLVTLDLFFSRDAQTFVKTIQNCISSRTAAPVEWRATATDRTTASIRKSEPVYAPQTPAQQQRLSTSRSCHALLPSNSKSDHQRRSPSPIWKRRTTPVRKLPIPLNVRRKTLRNSTDC